MARSLSTALLKGITSGLPASRPGRIVSGSFYGNVIRFSTSVPNDPDTHEDFRPTNKTQDSALSWKDIVEKDVKEHPVVIYMKGVPDQPACGFSALAVKILKHHDAPLHHRNILENPLLKGAIKDFSHWPTFPQIFINGEFIGGSDIILNLHQNGALKEKLRDVATNQYRELKEKLKDVATNQKSE